MTEHEQSWTPQSFLLFVLRPYRWYLLGWLIVICAWGMDVSIKSYALKLILDSVASGNLTGNLFFAVFIYILTALYMILIGRMHSWLFLKLTPKIKKNIAEFMISRVLGHSVEDLQSNMGGALANKVNDVINGVPGVISAVLDGFCYSLVTLFAASFTLYSVDSKYSVAVLIWIAFVVSITAWAMKRSKDLADISAESWSGIVGRIVDIFANITSIRFFSGRQHEYNQFNQALDHAVQKEQKKSAFLLKLYAFQGAALIGLQSYSLFLLVSGVATGKTTAGDFSLVLALNTSIADCLLGISQYLLQYTENMGKIQQGLKLMSYKEQLLALQEPIFKVSSGKIVFKDVSFNYKDASPLFCQKTLAINPGEKIGLVGHSGSGKSTFVKLILKMFKLTSGSIFVDDQNIATFSTETLSSEITLISQDNQLFHRSILENIAYGSKSATKEEIIAAAKLACADEFIQKMAQGYETIVVDQGANLSGGQRQRIALARAFLKKPKILILDEATSALDAITESIVLNNLKKMMEQKTLIMIAHRLSCLSNFDRIFVFDHGKVVAEGNHQELVDKNKLYKSLWEQQKPLSEVKFPHENKIDLGECS